MKIEGEEKKWISGSSGIISGSTFEFYPQKSNLKSKGNFVQKSKNWL